MINQLENGLFECYSEFSKISNKSIYTDNFTISDCRPAPWPNNIYDIRISNEDYADVISNIVKMIRNEGLPIDLVINEKFLDTYIENYLLNEFELLWNSPGMYIDLSEVQVSDSKNTDIEIQIAQKDDEFYKWSDVAANILFETDNENKIIQFANNLSILNQKGVVKCFSVNLHGKIIATSMLHLNDNVAGIYHVCVKKELRNNGYGRMITMEPLKFAKTCGFKYGFLVASDMGKPVYEKIGFKEFTRYVKYRLKKKD